LGYANVRVLCGDGTRGWPEEAPFDAIVVAAGSPGIPPALLDQLRIGGRLVIPVGEEKDAQQLIRVIRRGEEEFEHEELGAVRFVPLIGEAGWQPEQEMKRPTIPSALSKRGQACPI
jgi:protein-L-isoaspartate(D-aspartate) O-methyltransferase